MGVIKRITTIIIILLMIIASLCSCGAQDYFDNWRAESAPVPYVDWDTRTVSFGDIRVDVGEYLEDFGEYYLYEILVIYNSYIYCVCSSPEEPGDGEEDDKYTWNIASINMNSPEDIKICYAGEFGEIHDSFNRYEVVLTNEYSDKSGFYYDGKIVLKDKTRLVEYDIEKDEIAEYSPEDYQYPENEYHYAVQDERKEILLTNIESGYEKLITLDDMSDSTYGQELLKLREDTIWDGDSKACKFFHHVQFIGGEVYLICEVLNYMGESYALIFKYDVEADEYEYIDNYFFWDILGSSFYLVEYVEE